MDTSTIISLCSLGVTLGMSALLVAEKLWGGGNALAMKFSKLKEETNEKITLMRDEFINKHGQHSENSRVGFEAITSNIHVMQTAFLEFRANMAETYMRRESFYKAAERIELSFDKKNIELKENMKEGFQRVEKQLDEMAQAIEANRKTQSKM